MTLMVKHFRSRIFFFLTKFPVFDYYLFLVIITSLVVILIRMNIYFYQMSRIWIYCVTKLKNIIKNPLILENIIIEKIEDLFLTVKKNENFYFDFTGSKKKGRCPLN